MDPITRASSLRNTSSPTRGLSAATLTPESQEWQTPCGETAGLGTWGRTRRQGLLRAGPAAAGLAWGPLAHTGLSQEAGLALGRPHKTRQSGSKDSSGDPEACPGTHRPRQAGAEPWGPPAGVEGPCPTHLLQLVPQAVFCDTQGPHASRPTRRLQLLDIQAVNALLGDQLSKEEGRSR